MANFSDYLMEELYSLLKNEFEDIFTAQILPTNRNRIIVSNFREYLPLFMEDVFKDKTDILSIRAISTNSIRSRNKMKNNWHDATLNEIENPKTISAQNKTILKEFEGYKKMTESELKRAFNVDSFDNLLAFRLNMLKIWKDDKDSSLCSFRYFEDKKPFQKLTGFNYDLTLAIIKITNEHYSGSLDNFAIQRPSEFIEKPIFALSKMLLPIETAFDEELNLHIAYNDYLDAGDYVIRTLIKEPEKVKLSSIYSLDEKDFEIIDILASKIDSSFYKDKTVLIELNEVAKRVYGYVQTRSLREVEDRLMKISLYHIQGKIKEGENISDTRFSINFFDRVTIETDRDSKRRIAKVVFGETLHENYVNNKTVKVASYQFNQMVNPLSKMLFFIFQKERLEMSVTEQIDQPLIQEYSYSFFKNRIRFKSRKEKENIKMIEKSLEEFKNRKLMIEDYKVLPKGFQIKYIPLTCGEKQSFGLFERGDVLSLK